MNVADFGKSLLARPIACALIVALAVLAGIAGVLTAPHTYKSTAVLVVIPPGSGNPDAMMNPLVNLTNNMAQLAAVVATKMRTDGGAVATNAGGTGEFTVDTTFGDSPTFAQLTSQLVIEAKASSAVAAQRTTQALADFADTALQKIQADSWVPSHNNAVIVSSVSPQPGSEISNSPVKSGGAYAFATLLAGVLVLIGYDAWITRRRDRAANRSERANAERPMEERIDERTEEHDAWADDAPMNYGPFHPGMSPTDLHRNGQ
jgi:hypothetical protein